MEAAFEDDLRILANALRNEGFRFVIIGHNRHSIYADVAAWLRDKFPARQITEIVFTNKDSRQIINALTEVEKGIVLIPDFDWLFRKGNESLCTSFNQRRDAVARKNAAFICFVQPSNFRNLSKLLPDWWSLRSLEFDFHRMDEKRTTTFQNSDENISSLGGNTRAEKEAEIENLLRQVTAIHPYNQKLLASLYSQIAMLYLELDNYDKALIYWGESLEIALTINDFELEANTLLNISQAHKAQGEYDIALEYSQQGLELQREKKNKFGEATALNNIGRIYFEKHDYDTALMFLQEGLAIRQEINDRKGEANSLHNISPIYKIRGDYKTAFNYLQQSLKIRQEISDYEGQSNTLNSIGQLYSARGDFDKALEYLEQSLKISQQIGDQKGERLTLNNISRIHYTKGNKELAIEVLKQCLSIQQAIGSRKGQSITLTDLATMCFEIGDFKSMSIFAQQNLKLQEELKDLNGLAKTFHMLGNIELAKTNLEKAVKYYLDSYTIYDKIKSPDIQHIKIPLNIIKAQIGEAKYQEIVNKIKRQNP